MTGELQEPADGKPDAVLVARVLDGDRDAFASVYDRYADRLFDFAHSMLRNREDAADAVADAFVTFAEKLSQLRDPDSLRPWLYAIVRSQCLHRIKARGRIAYGGDEAMAEMADTGLAPDDQVAASALQRLVWDAAGGLAERDRSLLDLHLRQGLDGAELGEAMCVSASNAYVMMNRLRGQLERSLGALMVATTGRSDCHDLDRTLEEWDGEFSPLVRKRVARHVDGCAICTARKAALVSPLALFAGVPAFAAPAGLRERVLNNFALEPGSTAASTGGHSWIRWAVMAGVAAVIVTLVVFFIPGRLVDSEIVAPVDAPASVTPTPTPSASPTASPPVIRPAPPPRAEPDPEDKEDEEDDEDEDSNDEPEDPRPEPPVRGPGVITNPNGGVQPQ